MFVTGCCEGCPAEGEQPGKCSTGSQQRGWGCHKRDPKATVCLDTEQAAIFRAGNKGTRPALVLSNMRFLPFDCTLSDTLPLHNAQAPRGEEASTTLHVNPEFYGVVGITLQARVHP